MKQRSKVPQAPRMATAWVRPIEPVEEDLRDAERELKAAGLDDDQLARLRTLLEVEAASSALVQAWPTEKADDQHLVDVAEAAQTLAERLKACSPRADVRAAVALGRSGMAGQEGLTPDGLALRLQVFAALLRHRPATLQQRRPEAPVWPLRALADVAGTVLGIPSKNPTSTFYKAAQATFTLVGLKTSPDRAIEQLKRESAARHQER